MLKIWPLSQTGIVGEGHLKIGIIYILISKDLQRFMKFWALVFDVSRSQGICSGHGGGDIIICTPYLPQSTVLAVS